MTLRPADLDRYTRQLGIDLEVLEQMHVRRVDDREAREALGINGRPGRLDGLLYPYLDPQSGRIVTHRLRRDHPEMEDGKPKNKYLSGYADQRHLYFATTDAILLTDPSVPAIAVEAETSKIAAMSAAWRCQRRLLAIGLGGCWGWRGRIGKTSDPNGATVDEVGPLPDLQRVTWINREVVLAFDANAATNPKVMAARRALAQELLKRGARVRILALPLEEGINGPDDYIGRHGDAAFFALFNGAGEIGERAARTVQLTCASTIRPRPVHWLWKDRIPLGTFALVGGREGMGKSICVYTLAADVTRGRLPGIYEGTPHAVIVAATEDSWEHTIIPRLMAAEADLERVYRVDVVTADLIDTTLSLPKDLPGLERAVTDVHAALIVLDPLLSRLDASLDTHKDAEVRRALEPLCALGARGGATVVGLIHVNKSPSSDALTTLMGSRAFAAVARTVLFVMEDPDDDTTRLLGQAKNNLGQTDLPTLSFRIGGIKVTDTPEGPVWTGKLEWTGETDRTIRDVLETAAETGGDKTATAEAIAWLEDFLQQERGSADSAVIKKEAGKAGHSMSTLHRARQRLRLTAVPTGFPRRTFWALPASQSCQP